MIIAMKRKKNYLINCFLTVSLLFVLGMALSNEASSAEKPKYGGTLRIKALNLKQFDPAKTASYKTSSMISFIYEGLVTGDQEKMRNDPDFHRDVGGYTPPKFLKGTLAESWKWLDSKTLVFYLRKGVKWHNKPPVNGREFVADDVVYSYNRYMKSKRLDQYVLSHIDSVAAKDKYTVIFKLKKPYAEAVLHIGLGINHYNIPREVVEKHGSLSNWETAAGTGPFMLTNFSPGNALTFKRNPDYWDKGKPYLDEIKALVIDDVESILAALRTGKIDLIYRIPPLKVPGLKKTNPELKFRDSFGSPFVIYMRTDKKPFNDIRVRRALAMAVDRKAIVEKYWRGEAKILAFPFPPPWEEVYTPLDKLGEAEELYIYNPEKAKKLLKDAGYPNGFKTELTYTLGYGRVWAEQMELVKEYYSRVGIDLQLNLKEYMAYYTTAHKGKYEGMGAGLHGQSSPLATARYFLPGSTMNKSHVNDPKYIEMVEQMKKMYNDRPKFDEIAKKMNRYAVGQVWCIAMPSPYNYTIWHPWVKNFYGAFAAARYDMGHAFTDVWVDPTLKK